MLVPRLSLPSLLALALLVLPAAAQEGRPEEQAEPLDEKALVHDYDKAMKSKDAAARTAAVMALGDMSRQLPDKGVSRYMTKALAKALEDEDLEVQSAAVVQLAWGRDVDTTLDVLAAHVDTIHEGVDKRATRPDEESKAWVNRATRLFGDACKALANYRDDRAVDSLSSTIGKLRPNTDGNNTSTRLVGRIAEALLTLATADAVSACVKQCQLYTQTDGFQEPAAKELHRVLSIFAVRVGKAGPDFSDNFYVDWDNWFEKYGETFAEKLGKLKEPPMSPPPDMGEGMAEGQDEGKPAPR